MVTQSANNPETQSRIGIDIRKYSDFGIGSYIRRLLTGLSSSHPDHTLKYTLYHTSNQKETFPESFRRHFDFQEFDKNPRTPFQGILPANHLIDVFHAPHYIVPDPEEIPVILTVHDCIHVNPPPIPNHFPSLKKSTQWISDHLKRMYHQATGRIRFIQLVRQAQRVITVSDSTTEVLLEILDIPLHRITRIYNCLDDIYYQEISEEQTRTFSEGMELPYREYILYSGNDLYHKNVEGLFFAWRIMRKELQRNTAIWPRLVLCGPRRINTLKQLASRLGIEKDIHLITHVQPESMPYLYHCAMGLIMPTLAEGFGFPVAEAMACGTPVLCSDIPVFHEITHENAIYFDPFDIDEMAFKMNEFILNYNRNEERIISGKNTALNYHPEPFIRSHISVYRDVLEEIQK